MKLINNKKLLLRLAAGALFLAVTFIVYWGQAWTNGAEEIQTENLTKISKDTSDMENEKGQQKESYVVIDVSGAVKKPDVLVLPMGSRVYQAVEAAGGLCENAETKNINLAMELNDGTKLYIPTMEEVRKEEKNGGINSGSMPTASSYGIKNEKSGGNLKININIADSNELQKLTGVGPSTADKILDYREQYGFFKKIEDLMNVSGIGEKTFQKLKDKICVE